MNILKSTDRFEDWLREELGGDLVHAELKKKRKKMARDPFSFLRGTYWRWAEIIGDHIGDAAEAPSILAVGDIHLENYGTWRDQEGRLVWGVNDYDEAAEMPYTFDLVRLTTSALLALDNDDADPAPIADAILGGYIAGLETPRPFILDGGHDESIAMHRWLREQTIVPEDDRKLFWDELEAERIQRKDQAHGKHPPYPSIPPRFEQTLRASLPPDAGEPDIWYRSAGLGSLGRPRFVARAAWRGGWTVRETKALIPSAWTRTDKQNGRAVRCMELASGRYRCPDPWFRVTDSLVVRRLSPNNRKIECTLGSPPEPTRDPGHSQSGDSQSGDSQSVRAQSVRALRPRVLLHEMMLSAMGQELAAVHLGTRAQDRRPRDGLVQTDCRTRTAREPRWLERAAHRAAGIMRKEWKKFQSSVG